nr:hypothetical protein [Tanacetum cinerariifolium]
MEEALEQALSLFEFRGFSSFNERKGGESDEAEVEGVRVGRRDILPLDLNRKTLLLERGIMTWSTSWKSLDKGRQGQCLLLRFFGTWVPFLCGIRRHELRLDLCEKEDRGWSENHNILKGMR